MQCSDNMRMNAWMCVCVCVCVLVCVRQRERGRAEFGSYSLKVENEEFDLHCVAVCCSVLQCVAVCGSVLQCAAVCCSVLQCVAVCCSVLQCVAVCVWERAELGSCSLKVEDEEFDTVIISFCVPKPCLCVYSEHFISRILYALCNALLGSYTHYVMHYTPYTHYVMHYSDLIRIT